MKYCKNCNLKIDGNQTKCVFCGGRLEKINDEISTGFSTKKPKHFYLDIIERIMVFSLLALIAVSIMLEIYLFADRQYWLLVSFTSVYIYLMFKVISCVSRCAVGKISQACILTSLETIGVFAFFKLGLKEICLTYVYPCLIFASFIAILALFFASNRKKIHDQLIYIFINILWGLTPIIFLATRLVNPTYLSSICVVISALTLIGFLIFSIRDSKEEMKRRFHV